MNESKHHREPKLSSLLAEDEVANVPSEPENSDLEAEVARLSTELEAVTQEKRELNERLLRLAAEHENSKKRLAKEIEDVRFQTKEKMLREFLTILDGLDRALEATEQGNHVQTTPSALVEGVRLVQKQFLAALERFDVRPVDVTPGTPFDPQHHEAVQQIESNTFPPNTVAQIVRRGFVTTGNRLLRPTLVVVTKPNGLKN